MRYNKIVSWESFLGIVERVHEVSPWLSRHIAKRAAEWPFWYSGVKIERWENFSAWVSMPASARNTVDGLITQGHLLLGAEFAVRLMLLKFKQELPFRYWITGSSVEVHHEMKQPVNFKFNLEASVWESLRLELVRSSKAQTSFVLMATLEDGRLASTITFHVALALEKFLPA